jgi:DNA-binding transcriptional MerR regulator
MAQALTIGEASRASGLPTETIRYYERIGVLPPVRRRQNSYRAYAMEHVETLRFARRLRELGVPPGDMASLVRIFHEGSCRDMQTALLSRVEELVHQVRARREELQRAEVQLSALAAGLRAIGPDDRRLLPLEPCQCIALVETEGGD